MELNEGRRQAMRAALRRTRASFREAAESVRPAITITDRDYLDGWADAIEAVLMALPEEPWE